MSPTLTDLARIAAALDVTLHMAHITDANGYYCPEEARVYIDFGLTPSEQRSVIAHELGHAYHGHVCGNDRAERDAWSFAADLLVDAAEYARLEREGHSPAEIADDMCVTLTVIDAFQRHHLQRLGLITYGHRLRGRFTNSIARRLA